MIRRLFPHPLLSILLILVWMMLANSFAWGSLVFAVIMSIIIPAMIAPYWPDRPRIHRPFKFLRYGILVVWDIIVANIEVAKIVLFKPNRDLKPAWINVPLELTSPEAIAVLGGTITLTPGTVTCDVSEEGNALLVHCLHAPDPDAIRDEIKARYENRLKEIFE
ncbi:Na+/H+ antiporter subunit E [Paracoccus tegillarcae]|uniref:Na+/H+ antiporter subunit E n=1 Tax=Paracoccus tegillarcae TaxID=1529068 RepID=A0A2K9EHN3_9RHOB|nr:Na+/H+ antiporter subunit E [Paracoccus tegillarcae]AUH32847.1 Na+/H+ antiporter subunit E [Paracoccus tegillarcae]